LEVICPGISEPGLRNPKFDWDAQREKILSDRKSIQLMSTVSEIMRSQVLGDLSKQLEAVEFILNRDIPGSERKRGKEGLLPPTREEFYLISEEVCRQSFLTQRQLYVELKTK